MNARLDFLSGSKAGTSISLLDSTLTVGRDREQSISFALTDIVISAQHAILTRHGDTYSLRDAGSKNGTFVNGEPITEHELADGDQVQFGAGGPIASFRLSSREYPSTVKTRKTPAAQPRMPEPGRRELSKIIRRETLRRT